MNVWRSAEFDGHEQICVFTDEKVGLKAIVAIHSTALGPAAGGTRFKPYARDDDALDDALRLSRAMSYKSALAGLPVGGGKAVIIGDPRALKSTDLLHAYGRFIDRIGRTFATGEDVGITVADMDRIAEVTPFVGGTSRGIDPSIPTAEGVVQGLRAVLKRLFGTDCFDGVRLAVQGLGAVGWGVAERLHAQGARLVVADIREERVQQAVTAFNARSAACDTIHAVDCDIFVPCALGGVISKASVIELKSKAVAGSANNQLASPEAGAMLARRGILFAPDYVINAGGIISGIIGAASLPGREMRGLPPLDAAIEAIYDRLMVIFDHAEASQVTPEIAAERMARKMIGRG